MTDLRSAFTLSAGGRPGCSRPTSDGSSSAGLLGIDVLEPAMRIRRVTLDDVEEALLDGLGHRAPASRAHSDAVHRLDRRDLDGGADEEHLVRHIQHFSWQYLLANLEAEVAGDRDHRVTG